jgi:hypothetical protein
VAGRASVRLPDARMGGRDEPPTPNMRPAIPEEVEEFRDRTWCREDSRRIETPHDAERFIERLGFAACLTDARRPGPSLYVAVCGRRDAVMPRNVQTDPEASHTWQLKDQLVRRGRVYYAKLARGKATFIAPGLLPYFNAVWGVRRRDEPRMLSRSAQAVLRVLRREWEMASSDLRADAGIADRVHFTKALDELQAAMLVVPSEVLYRPKFTYIWTLAISRFPDQLRRRVPRATAVRELARAFLTSAGTTMPGEFARVVGLSRAEAGLGNRALLKEGFCESPARGIYRLVAGSQSEGQSLADHDDPRHPPRRGTTGRLDHEEEDSDDDAGW